MPLYFFHTADGSMHRDQDGTELSGDDDARHAAVRYAGEILVDMPELLDDQGQLRVEVTREDRTLVCTVLAVEIGTVPAATTA